MKKIYTLLLLAIAISSNIIAKDVKLDSENRDPKYVETILGRSQKIIDNLNINDSNSASNVLNIVANRYFMLNDVYENRDKKLATIKEKTALSKEEKTSEIEKIVNEKDAALYKAHFSFQTELSQYLDEKQVEAVKDGMTFGVVGVTYTATLEMIPSLKDDEKRQIYAWLIEAREYAMNEESSSKKHNTFGRYKGKINNYLSQRGYYLTKERAEWEKRIKDKK